MVIEECDFGAFTNSPTQMNTPEPTTKPTMAPVICGSNSDSNSDDDDDDNDDDGLSALLHYFHSETATSIVEREISFIEDSLVRLKQR